MKISAVILAAGESSRFGSNKLLTVLDEPLINKTVRVFLSCNLINEIVLVVNQKDLDLFKTLFGDSVKLVVGGKTRRESAFLGVNAADGDYVLIHDGARVNVKVELIERVISQLVYADGVIPVVDQVDTQIDLSNGLEYKDRRNIKNVQTPQAFKKDKLLYAYQNSTLQTATDDGSVFAEFYPLSVVDGDVDNIKITYPEDVYGIAGEVRFGVGYDCHRLVKGRDLILGGMKIPNDKGLEGVSDADVVLHALMDALLNACALGDIGKFFPPDDPKYKGANSVGLTLTVLKTIKAKGFYPQSASITVLAEKPKLKDHIPLIRKNIATLLGVAVDNVGVGATTTEGIGFIGREEGISCYATCVVRRKK